MNKTLAVAAVVLAMGTAPGMAVDLIVDDQMTTPTSAYDWDGVYAGVSGGIWNDGTSYFYLGGLIGANFVQGDLLLGIEGSAEFFPTSPGDFSADASGRLGLILDNVVIYGTAGVGTVNGSSFFVTGGVGAELGLTDMLSVAGQIELTSTSVVRGETSLRFHF